jgi:hypothetical protein
MVNLPPQYVATKFPGYFFNTENKKLYSLKVSGILTPLKHIIPNRFNCWYHFTKTGGYRVSVDGSNRVLTDEYLASLTPNENSEIPTKD